ncbi:MAG: cadmium-translocating P-type ATPase [Clostridiales bacterium]|nr:cadmium-translocating P-type ATPase [Clostridiales bacterium]
MKKDIACIAAGAVLLVAALIIPEEYVIPRFIVFLLAFIAGGLKVVANAFKGIIHGNIFNENTLMVIAAVGAFCIAEYPEAVFVVLFYRVGEMFEDYAVKKSRNSVKEVMNICPEYANLIEDGKIRKVDPDEVKIGDLISVAAGERVPLDGIVTSGSSFVDTSALTGESVPRAVNESDEILSGCINQNGLLTVRVTKTFDNSTVSRILELVENASAKKSKSEKFITKFAKYYTPIVIAAAVLLAVIPPLVIDGASFRDYIYRALSFLVVSCPCALVISVPLSFFGGIGSCAKQGILIKGGNYIEMLSKADVVVFDKTGTLTKGVFAVKEINPVGITEEELLEKAVYAENISSHPIAESLREKYGRNIELSKISHAEEIPGHGVKAVIEGEEVLAGNGRLMESCGIPFEKKSGGTIVYVAVDNIFRGSIIISDEIKEDARELVPALKRQGITETVMLTGDEKSSAERVAAEIGIDKVHSGLLPDGKVAALEEIMDGKGTKGSTAYVGDGINDAPVLARADVGIAMGALGSDAAVEAADVVIMNDSPLNIAAAVKISKKTMNIARENIIGSLIVKIAILVLCSLNIVQMGVAVFGDVGVMVLAVLNSFRALKNPKNPKTE